MLTKYAGSRANLYGKTFLPCPSKKFPGDGQRLKVAAELGVTQRHHPLGNSLGLGVLPGHLTIFNKDGEFSHLIFFCNREGSALTGINCVHEEKGNVPRKLQLGWGQWEIMCSPRLFAHS